MPTRSTTTSSHGTTRICGPSMMRERTVMGAPGQRGGNEGEAVPGVALHNFQSFSISSTMTFECRTLGGMTAIEQAAALVDNAQRICVLTGAGISTDSGIPDFRGPN